MNQERWPRGTPVRPDGGGPGGGRFRGSDWAGQITSIMSRRDILRMPDGALDQRALEAVRVSQSIPDTRSTYRPSQFEDWAPERAKMHDRILRRLMARYRDTPTQRRVFMAGGLAGAGKTSTLSGQTDGYMPIDPDEIKEEILAEGGVPDIAGTEHLSPMELATAIHLESVYLADRLLEMAAIRGRNVLIDTSMGTSGPSRERMRRLQLSGYRARGAFVDVPPEVSKSRAAARYRAQMRAWARGEGPGGRPIPLEFIEKSRDPEHPQGWTRNRQVFAQLAAEGWFDDGWAIYDNSGDRPILIDKSG